MKLIFFEKIIRVKKHGEKYSSLNKKAHLEAWLATTTLWRTKGSQKKRVWSHNIIYQIWYWIKFWRFATILRWLIWHWFPSDLIGLWRLVDTVGMRFGKPINYVCYHSVELRKILRHLREFQGNRLIIYVNHFHDLSHAPFYTNITICYCDSCLSGQKSKWTKPANPTHFFENPQKRKSKRTKPDF